MPLEALRVLCNGLRKNCSRLLSDRNQAILPKGFTAGAQTRYLKCLQGL